MYDLSPLPAFAGGILIGVSASVLLWLNGRIAGISGIARNVLWAQSSSDRSWRLLFLVGLILGGLIYVLLFPNSVVPRQGYPMLLIAAAGLLVGIGTAMSGGCTSGHGVCGLGRVSVRSLAATLTFLLTGIVTVYLLRHVIGLIA